jgi:hypothetical protein
MFSVSEFLLFCFATIGLTLIIVQGVIFQPLREKLSNNKLINQVMNCLVCCGFWCGFFCGFFLIMSDVIHTAFVENSVIVFFRYVMMLFCCGVAGSFLAALGDLVLHGLNGVKDLMVNQVLLVTKRLLSDKCVTEKSKGENGQVQSD